MNLRPTQSLAEAALDTQPVVVVLGPRKLGKSLLAGNIAEARGAVMLDLDRHEDRWIMEEPGMFLDAHAGRLVVIDEVQRMPQLLPLIAERAGRDAGLGRFLLLGAARGPLVPGLDALIGSGRAACLELPPLGPAETGPGEVMALWLRGGMPQSLMAPQDRDSLLWREALIRSYLERDIPALGLRIPSEQLRRFWTMLAHEQGAVLNAARLAAGLGVSGQSVARYLDLLENLMLLRRLPPWEGATGRRLVKSPKVHIRDSGLVHALLDIESLEELLGHPVAAGSWEGFCIEALIRAAPPGARAWFYRSSAGAEIDLVLRMGDGALWAFEIRRGGGARVSRGFHGAADAIGARRRFLVHGGTEAAEGPNGLCALPLCAALERLGAV